MISIQCNQCQRKLRVPETAAGRNVKCPCGSAVAVPQTTDVTPHSIASSPERASASATSNLQNPPVTSNFNYQCECGRKLRVAQSDKSKNAKCPCGMKFVVPSVSTTTSELARNKAPSKPLPVKRTPTNTNSNLPPLLPLESPSSASRPSVPNGSDWLSEIPASAPYLPPANSAGPNPYPATTSSYSIGQDYLAQAEKDRKRRRSEEAHGDGDSSSFFNSTVIGGGIMMAVAAIWFAVGLANDIIFFYPPVMFILGLGGVVKGLFGMGD